MLLVSGRRNQGSEALDGGEPSDQAGVAAVGFFQQAQALGKTTHRLRMQQQRWDAVGPEQGEGLLLVSSGGLPGDQVDMVMGAKGGQIGDAFWAVDKTVGGSIGPATDFQGTRGNIDSTNDLRHGNLPCACDCRPATVRSYVTTARAQRYSTVIAVGVTGAPCRARGLRPSAPSPRHFLIETVAAIWIQGVLRLRKTFTS